MKFYEFQRWITDESNIVRTKMHDMNADVLMLIFDQLELQEMLRFATAYPNKRILSVARQYFRSRFNNYRVYIQTNSYNDLEANSTAKKIKVSLKKSFKLLKIFGSAIQSLEIQFPTSELMQFVNKYLSDTLVTFKLTYARNDTLHQFAKPFTKVVNFSFGYNDRHRIKADHVPLNQLFPNVRHLFLSSYEDLEFDSMYCSFPHLEQFEFYHPFKELNESMLETFFQMNPNIQSLILWRLRQNMCNVVNNNLGNLENLTLGMYSFEIEEDTTFDHVKHFKIDQCIFGPNYASMNLLSFPRLESLAVSYATRGSLSWARQEADAERASALWAEFGRNHDHVSRLKVAGVLGSHNLIEWMSEFTNLIDIEIEHGTDFTHPVTVETINQIIQMNNKLTTLKLLAFCLTENELDELRAEFGDNWRIITHRFQRDGQDLVDLTFEEK